MTDKKLTDAEIVKALEEWLKLIINSYQTSLDLGEVAIATDTEEYMCLLRETIDLINRQKAEIERLKGIKTNDWLIKGISKEQLEQEKIDALTEEINRLQEENERLEYLLAYEEAKYTKCAKRLYKEGVKEFAERLKEKYGYYDWENKTIVYPEDEIDNLLKELVGDNDG